MPAKSLPPPISVLMSSTSYPQTKTAWQGVFIRHLVFALAKQKNIRLSLWSPPGNLPNNVEFLCNPQQTAWLAELMQRGGIAHLLRNHKLKAIAATLKLLYWQGKVYRHLPVPDIYHINWLQNSLPLPLKGSQPLLVSVLGSDLQLLKLPGMVLLLRHIFRRRKTLIAPNAEWMEKNLRRDFGDIAEIRCIPFGIDDVWYGIQRIPQDIPKWLVVLRLTRKKMGPLFEWGKDIFQDGRELHLFGPMQEKIDIPAWVHYHGPTHPAELSRTWFPQAAGLITLSQHDEGRPQVILEAMASSLPVIASRIPAHENIIKHGNSGYLVNSATEFKSAVENLSNANTNDMAGLEARAQMQDDIGTWNDCAGRYLQAYADLTGTLT